MVLGVSHYGPRHTCLTEAGCPMEKGAQGVSFGFNLSPEVTQLWDRGQVTQILSEPPFYQYRNTLGLRLGFGDEVTYKMPSLGTAKNVCPAEPLERDNVTQGFCWNFGSSSNSMLFSWRLLDCEKNKIDYLWIVYYKIFFTKSYPKSYKKYS